MASKDPPADLDDESKALWHRVVGRQVNISPGRRDLLIEAFYCRQRLHQVRDALNASTLTTVTAKTGATHLSPLAKLECELRRQLSTLWKLLGLHWLASVDGSRVPQDDEGDE